jgi:hypothetical protein
MSQVATESVMCPSCCESYDQTVFRSLNGERIPAQVQRLLDGTFELITCACGHSHRPEHRMLYSHYALRTWIAMYPRAQRDQFAMLEHGIQLVFDRDFRAAPPTIAAGLRGVLPRLVFGQAALSEAVRVSEAGLEPALLECAKLLLVRRNLAAALAHGPAELMFEGVTSDHLLQFGILELGSGTRRDTLTAPRDLLDEVNAVQRELATEYPELFARPYVSATRYLFGAHA